MLKGLLLTTLPLSLTCSLCCPLLNAVYDTSYWDGDHMDTVVGTTDDLSADCSSVVTFCLSEHGWSLASLSSTMTCVGQLAVADSPGPLTWQIQKAAGQDVCS